MNPKKILYAMNDIDNEFLNEAREKAPARRHSRKFAALMAAVIAVTAMTVTAFAAEDIAGWFKQYFSRNAENGLTPGQIEYLDEHEQIVDESQSHNGYSLKLKSVLSDGYTVYATVGLTAPENITHEDLKKLWGSDIDLYIRDMEPNYSWMMDVCDDGDGLENTVDLFFELTPEEWNTGTILTIHIKSLQKHVWNEEYEQELMETKYAGQENIMFTDEEAAKIHQTVTLAEGPWEFNIDLGEIEPEVLELVSEPITVQTCYGFKEDGTDLFKDVNVTSFILSPLSATIQTDCDYAPDFAAGGRQVYVVMADGSRIELIPNVGGGGAQRFRTASPIVLSEVDHVLLSDGTKLTVP